MHREPERPVLLAHLDPDGYREIGLGAEGEPQDAVERGLVAVPEAHPGDLAEVVGAGHPERRRPRAAGHA